MASSIDASTSGAGGVITTADNSGTLQLKSGGTTIATISSTGLALNTGNITVPSTAAPAFSAYKSAAQTITNASETTITFNTESFDTNNNFNTSSNAFTPTVAGYYYITLSVGWGSTSVSNVDIYIYKNSSIISTGRLQTTSSNYPIFLTSVLVYCNGSTDYISASVFQESGSSKDITAASNRTYFQGFLARSA